MNKITVDNIWAHLKTDESVPRTVLRAIEEKMTYQIKQYSRYRRTSVDFDISLYERGEQKFPTGLYSICDEILMNFGIDYEVYDLREKPTSSCDIKFIGKTLRPYQEEILENAVKNERGVIKVATGGGKTVIAAAIIAKIGVKTVFIVNSIDLLEQTYDEFVKMLNIEIGRVGGGHCDIKDVNICTIQTLHSALGLKYEAVDEECYIKENMSGKILSKKEEIIRMLKTCEMIICDEVHHNAANSYVNMMKAADKAFFRFGCSGTPYRMESTDLIIDAFSGKLISNVSASYLIDKGFLVPPKIYFLDPNFFAKYKFIKGSFPAIYQKWIVENKNRNKLISDCVERLMNLNKTVLITVTRIEHGERILEILNERLPGISVAFIKGEVRKEERKILLDRIREKKLNVLLGTALADEGLNLPALDSAIMAGGGKSLIKSLQRVGRTLRPFPNKSEAIIVDFYDHLKFLTGQSVKRMNIYKQEPRFQVFKSF